MNRQDLVELTAHIVSAYVEKNAVPRTGLADLIASVQSALDLAGTPTPVEEPPKPAVNPKRSVFPDRLISLEDGKSYKALKRHLTTRGLTPDEYRAKWGLPGDYPMVAPDYAAKRSELAKALGLGRKPAATKAAPAKPGRKKRA